MRHALGLAVFAALLSSAPNADPSPHAAPQAWVEMTASGAEARAVTDRPFCPNIDIDGRSRSMQLRAGPTKAFPDRICAASLAAGVRSVKVGGVALPAPSGSPRRLVIFGDSGCRLKGKVTQHCNDPSGWPFARVAALAAARRPDLVVHVGDYYYREKPCPAGEHACQGSPYGDRWPTWKAELFDPAAPLLATAPWVFTRGNHEDCKRGGAGWFRLLDAATKPKSCPARSDSFSVGVDGAQLWVVDSSDTDDFDARPDLVSAFAARLERPRRPGSQPPAWIVTHRPIWFASRSGQTLIDGTVNATERAAARRADLAGVQIVLSGHVHDFTSLDFGPGRPPQLVVGTGGDRLAAGAAPPPVTGVTMVDGRPAHAFTMGRFGYFLFERRGADWVGGFHDLSDALIARCVLRARSLSCVPGR